MQRINTPSIFNLMPSQFWPVDKMIAEYLNCAEEFRNSGPIIFRDSTQGSFVSFFIMPADNEKSPARNKSANGAETAKKTTNGGN